jgi:membrane protease YdiL (CAAX protease family)
LTEFLPSSSGSPDTCLDCGAPMRSGATFCPRCGLRAGDLPSASTALPSGAADGSLDVDRSPAWLKLKPALQLFGAMLACSFAGMIAYQFSSSPWVDVAVCACDAVLIAAFVVGDLDSLRPTFRSPGALPIAATSALVIGSALAISGYFAALQAMGATFLRLTDNIEEAGWPLWSTFLLLSIYPAVFEEIAFRGIILGRLEASIGMTEAWLVQAAMFSVLHLMPIIFPSHFLMGLVFGWLRRKSGSLYPGMVAHAAWNAWVVWQELAAAG